MAEPSLSEQETELEILKREIKQAEESLEVNFAKYCAEHMDAELEGLFFDNKEAFVKKILEMQNVFLKEQLGEKIQKAQSLEQEIGNKKDLAQLEQAQQAFLSQHPEADMNAISVFYEEELPPKYKKQLERLAGVDFFNALYELYKAFSQELPNPPKGQAPSNTPLPQRVEGMGTNAQTNPPELVMNRF
ncbi:Coiled-coil domain-containing protein [Helicobacter baculiformis]|uniref:Coiled-coil domain-containing protein n=1 Tax=Helicobacter baculiformis TaxID=427351 RepID=A0ABV7ZH62_9HELI|nr:Coiled-coil domain-containing protein [Helicobacter baculiformis]